MADIVGIGTPQDLIVAAGGDGSVIQQLKRIAVNGGGGGSVGISQASVTPTAGSGTIAAGGVSQALFAANVARKRLRVQNQSVGNLWIRWGASSTADHNSLLILPNAMYVSEIHLIDTRAVNIIGATTGQAFFCDES